MKVIDLLNRIANGEDVPKKIKYYNKIYEFNNEENAYYINVEEDDEENYGRNFWSGYNFNILNDEIEIIEENKKIEKLKVEYGLTNYKINNYYGEKVDYEIAVKINELIDKINKLETK